MLYVAMYVFLIVGGCSMVYPFLLMISGSTKSAIDIRYFDAVPRFIYNDLWLYRKHMEGLFNESLNDYNRTYDKETISFDKIEPLPSYNIRLADHWLEFLKTNNLPDYAFECGYTRAQFSGTTPSNLRRYKQWLQERFGEDIDQVNRKFDVEYAGWNSVYINLTAPVTRSDRLVNTPVANAVREFFKTVPWEQRIFASTEGAFKEFMKVKYSKDIQKYNRVHGTNYPSYRQVHLARRCHDLANRVEREDWQEYVRFHIAIYWIRAGDQARPAYHEFLKAKYERIDVVNRLYQTGYTSFQEVPVVGEPKAGSLAAVDWDFFISGWKAPDGREHAVPITALEIRSVETAYQDWTLRKYKTLAGVNAELGTDHKMIAEILPPQEDFHLRDFHSNKSAIKWEFITRNYKTVCDYLLFHGRGVFNTIVYCAIAILAALIINPFAAYAMSRYRMPSTYKILLFCMCTMAFPPMVTGIPNFLLLRHFNLLNTFAALILPGLANGYAIFLLKGFFDSVPRELYESASLDGANEIRMFWNITMALSKPILAVIALQAFNMAYTNFMFAFVVCQDEQMWTLMVWLYQLQQRSGQAVVYASLIIAAIPTLLVFLLCQNVIMRGIVVPSEK